MKVTEASDILADYLGLPSSLIFEGNEKLSAICVKELSKAVSLPGGFSFSKNYRSAKKGEYFLDLRVLVNENRLLVYKAVKDSDDLSIIMKAPSSSNPSMQKVGFNMDVCVNNANVAYVGSTPVTMLTPYIDTQGYVAVIGYNDRIMLLHVDELSNEMPSNAENSPGYDPGYLISEDDKNWINTLIKDAIDEEL